MKKAEKNKSKFIAVIRWLSSISIIAVLLWVMYIYAGKLLCHIALGQIGELTNTKIKAGSIKYMANGSVLFTDLVVKPCKSEASNCEIIRAKKLFASFDKKSLFLLQPTLNFIDVNDFVFNAVYDIDKNWSNLSGLKIKPSSGSIHKAPDIHLGSGTLQYVKIINGQEEMVLSVPVDADFESNSEERKMYHFDITTATMSSGYGLSRLQGFWEPGHVIVTGGVSSLSVPKFEMAWYISVSAAELKYDEDNNYSLDLTIKDMQSLRNNESNVLDVEIPPFAERYGFITALQKFLDTYRPKGVIDVDLEMSGNLHKLTDSTINGNLHCRDIAFNHSKFPYSIQHLIGDINFTHESISFGNLRGKHGDSEISFNGWYRNFGPNREYKVDILSDELPLNDDLFEALNANQQKFWSSFSPAGNVSIDLQIERNDEIGRETYLEIELLDVDAKYDNFPYPLKNLSGELIFSSDKIVVRDAFSRDGDIEIKLDGEIMKGQMDDPPYNFIIDVNNVPMNSVLETALLEDQKEIYQSFQPTGLTDGSITVSRTVSGDINYSADMNFRDASVKMDFLEEPVTNIVANVLVSPDMAVIKKLSGTYGDMPVLLTGRLIPEKDEQLCYDVSLNMKKVRLNDKELQSLLPESIKKTVESFDPNGIADMILDLKQLDPEKPVDYSVLVNCLGNRIYFDDFNISVSDVTGLMEIDSNNVTLKNVTAFLDDSIHEESEREKIFLNGDIRIDNGAMKQAELSLSANNISFDDKFIKLLPLKYHNLYKTLSPSGTIDIDFNKFNLINNSEDNNTFDFNGTINLGNCDFVLSDKPAKLNSIIRLYGKYTTGEGFSDCKINVDEGILYILGKYLTELRTEVTYDPNQKIWSSEYLLADLYGGKTTGQLELLQQEDSQSKYVLEAAFENVNLERFLSDTNDTEENSHNHVSGKMSGAISLSSQIPQNNSRVGTCSVLIKNMQIGKMSPLAKLFQVLNLNEPSEYAFDSMLIDSYIKRNGLFVDKLDMSGKSVAFQGSGLISLSNGDVDLSLTARGRRLATDDPSIFQSLTEGLGQAVMRMDVTGDYRNIKVVTKTLPVIEGTLQIFGEPRVEN
ncbi:MAG: hypothetical protein JXA96_05165 [Sedimentisphaerales bacterium]|nr:hypothetical protein [Sedimentisphaerales bacterium]